jgi:hypothetical protein
MFCLPKANLIIASRRSRYFLMKVTKVKSGDGQVLVEPTGTLFWRPLDVLLFRRARKYFFHNFFDSLGY